MNRAKNLVPTTIALATLLFSLQGCGSEVDNEETERLAELYAEVLIQEATAGKGSDKSSPVIDSLLQINGFDSIADLQARIETLAQENPDGLRAMMDSTQKRLENIRDGVQPDTTQSSETQEEKKESSTNSPS